MAATTMSDSVADGKRRADRPARPLDIHGLLTPSRGMSWAALDMQPGTHPGVGMSAVISPGFDDDDVEALRGELAQVPLPATQDDLLAHLVARHVSVRLVRRLADLPRTQQYWSLEDICQDVARHRP